MKLNYRGAILSFCVIIFVMVNLARAQWNALNSGYAVTTDYHGIEIPPGTLVTATAGTTDSTVGNVTFIWKYPNETEAFIDSQVPVEFKGNYWTNKSGSFPIYEANSSYLVDLPFGNWGVQAFFIGEDGKTKAGIEDVIMIRATSINVVPDFPVVGTAGALVSMFLGLSLFLHRKKR